MYKITSDTPCVAVSCQFGPLLGIHSPASGYIYISALNIYVLFNDVINLKN